MVMAPVGSGMIWRHVDLVDNVGLCLNCVI